MEEQWGILFLAPTGGKVAVGRIGGAGRGGVGSSWGERLQIVDSYQFCRFGHLNINRIRDAPMTTIFSGFSANIDLQRLEHRSRRLLGAGYLFAATALVFLALTWHAPSRVARIAEKPETVMHADIIILPAKPEAEPFHMSPPKQTRRMARPEHLPAIPAAPSGRLKSAGIALAPGFESSFELPSGLGQAPSLPGGPDSTRFAPDGSGVADNGAGGRVPEGRINLTDEFIDIGALDDGRDKALIIRDPGDPRNVKGFVHIPIIRGVFLAPYDSTTDAFIGLAEATYRYTGITVKIDPPVFLNTPKLKKYPFIYITSQNFFELTRDEARGFREYLDGGGFALLEPYGIKDPVCNWPQAAPAMIKMMEDTFGGKFQRTSREAEFRDLTREVREKLGESVKLCLIPNTHEFFKSFFDLDISGGDTFPHLSSKCPMVQPGNYLEGIWRQRRLALVYSEKEYGRAWSELSDLRMGVNMLVFALSQSGGKTRQLVDGSSVTSQQKRTWWDYKSRMQYLDEEKSSLNPKYRTKTQ